MNKYFIPYEQALALKELGFNESCFCAYGAWGLMSSNDVNSLSDVVTQEDLDNQGYNEEDGVCLAPLYSQAFEFFREKHDLYHTIGDVYGDFTKWSFVIGQKNKGLVIPFRNNDVYFDTPEEAELACLNKLIELVKNK